LLALRPIWDGVRKDQGSVEVLPRLVYHARGGEELAAQLVVWCD
jgi:hypothetical protein